MTDQTSELLLVEQQADLRHKTHTLGEEAALFLADRSAASPWQRVIVCDFEFIYDMDAFKRYQIAENDATQGFVRWPFHRIVAGAWCMLTISPDMDRPVVTNVEAITNEPEEDIVGAFFAVCSAFQDARILSWGGEAKDFLCLKRVAIERGMVLPPQLRDPAPFARSRLDLSSAVRSLGHYVHLPEFCEAIGVASKPMPSKDIALAVRHGAWDHVETQVVADVCTIAQVAWRYFLATGAASGTPEAGNDAVISALAERFPDDAWLAKQRTPFALAA